MRLMPEMGSYVALFEPEAKVVDRLTSTMAFLRQLTGANALRLYDATAMHRGWPKPKKVKAFEHLEDLGGLEELVTLEFKFSSGLDSKLSGQVLTSGPAAVASVYVAQVSKGSAELLVDRLVARIASIAAPGYGYAEQCPASIDPFLHVLGITSGFPQSEEENREAEKDEIWFSERVLGWGKERIRRFRDSGMLRDVYTYNILNELHLSYCIEGSSLRSVIQKEGWGTLKPLPGLTWAWSLDEAEVVQARSALESAGQLICPRSWKSSDVAIHL
jgi:hypothetical protein